MSTVELRIEFTTGNAAASTPEDCRHIIRRAAMRAYSLLDTERGPGSHVWMVRDDNGNTIGRASLTLPELDDEEGDE